MAVGAGKYDDELTQARLSANAVGAVLLIVQGDRGSGVGIQIAVPDEQRMPLLGDIILMLEKTLENMRKDFHS